MNDNTGWIKLYRSLRDSAIWKGSNPNQRSVIITILLMANHSPAKWTWNGEEFSVEAGQFVTSFDKLAKEAAVSRSCAIRTVQKLKSAHFADYSPTHSGILINVDNWAKYQSREETTGTDTGTISGTEEAENRNSTGTVPDTNKNNKNDIEGWNKKDVFIPPSVEEVRQYITERGYHVDATKFVTNYRAKGWRIGNTQMSDWRAAVDYWQQNDRDQRQTDNKSGGSSSSGQAWESTEDFYARYVSG